MRLTLVIEGSKGSETVQKIIRMMRRKSLAAIDADPAIQAVYQPLVSNGHLQSLEIILAKQSLLRGRQSRVLRSRGSESRRL